MVCLLHSTSEGAVLILQIATLAADLTIPFQWATDYASPNLTLAGELWESIDFDVGMVALPYDWTDEKDLPRAQVFPWDQEQGLYVLNGYHALHCLVKLRLICNLPHSNPPTKHNS